MFAQHSLWKFSPCVRSACNDSTDVLSIKKINNLVLLSLFFLQEAQEEIVPGQQTLPVVITFLELLGESYFIMFLSIIQRWSRGHCNGGTTMQMEKRGMQIDAGAACFVCLWILWMNSVIYSVSGTKISEKAAEPVLLKKLGLLRKGR